MISFKRILFPTDFSNCSAEALKYALFVANTFGSELHIFHAVVLHKEDPYNLNLHFPNYDELQRVVDEIAVNKIDGVFTNHQIDDLKIFKAKERGIAAGPLILDYSEKNEIDLIVMGTHGHRGLTYLLLGSVAEEVLRLAPCPVLTVRGKNNKVDSPKRILIPIDFSDYSLHALQYGIELAKKFTASLDLLHVVKEPVPTTFSMVMNEDSIDQMYQKAMKKSEEELVKIGNSMEVDVKYKTHVISGPIAKRIVESADRNDIGLIIMGSHGLTGIMRFLLGSNTEKVLRQVDSPVLTVKLPG